MQNDLAGALAQLKAAQQPQPVSAEGLSGLQALPVFDGMAVGDRNRALLQAGLAMMNPAANSNPISQLSQGIQAGLTSVDQTKAQGRAAQQQDLTNAVALMGQQTSQQQADTQQKKVEADTQFNLENLQRQKDEFAALDETRAADILLKKAQAGYYDRMPDKGAGGAGGEKLKWDKQRLDAAMYTLLVKDMNKPASERAFHSNLVDGSWQNDRILQNAAFEALSLRENFGDAAMALVVGRPGTPQDLGTTLQQIGNPGTANPRASETIAAINETNAATAAAAAAGQNQAAAPQSVRVTNALSNWQQWSQPQFEAWMKVASPEEMNALGTALTANGQAAAFAQQFGVK